MRPSLIGMLTLCLTLAVAQDQGGKPVADTLPAKADKAVHALQAEVLASYADGLARLTKELERYKIEETKAGRLEGAIAIRDLMESVQRGLVITRVVHELKQELERDLLGDLRPQAVNLASNQADAPFPKASASFCDAYGGIAKRAIDGQINYQPTPLNRWTSYGSPNPSDWLEVEFAGPTAVGRVVLHIYDDQRGVHPPQSYSVEVFRNGVWSSVGEQKRSPAIPTGGVQNTVTFSRTTVSRLRVVFVHRPHLRSGVTELEAWKE